MLVFGGLEEGLGSRCGGGGGCGGYGGPVGGRECVGRGVGANAWGGGDQRTLNGYPKDLSVKCYELTSRVS